MIDLPGYRIQRSLGEGGSAHIYLGLQHAFGRPVAIKMLRPAAVRDASFRERFLREAEIAKDLDHPNIVRVIDAGWHGDTPYLVMEYMRGGDLHRNLAAGLHMQNVVMVVKEIAAALDYAHGKGVVHQDVKPENILFNEQGTALLSDFGIATLVSERAASAPSDRVAGTRPYMSPEQLDGCAVDGRSDLFSLGVVFYRMLTGRLPYDDGDGSAPTTYLREPLLPLHLSAFQSVLRKLLATSPAERHQSGAELSAALDRVRIAGLIPDAVVKTDAVATAEIETAVASLGRQGDRQAAAGSARGRRVLPLSVLAGLLVAAVGAGTWYVAARPGGVARILAQAGLVEHPDAVRAWQDAQALAADPNQRLAVVVAAYRRVLGYEAGHPGAAAAVAAAAERSAQDVSAALDAGDSGLAEAKLTELAEVFPADPGLTALFDRLTDLRHAQRLLTDTERLLASSGLDDVRAVEAAIVTYKEVLRLMPDNAVALQALNEIAVRYGALAERDARAQNVAAALANFDRAFAANPQFAGVETVRATLSEAEALLAEINAVLQQAAQLRQRGALIDPPGENAAELYRLVLATKPEDALAVQGLSEVSAQVLTNFRDLLDQGRLADAASLLDRAAASGIGETPVREMQTRYDDELARIAAVKTLIVQAEALYAVGYITGPVRQDNAIARLREALRLDPNNPDALRLLSLAATRLASAAQDAYSAGLAEDALRYLDLALTVTPSIGRWQDLREQWQADMKEPVPRQTPRQLPGQ